MKYLGNFPSIQTSRLIHDPLWFSQHIFWLKNVHYVRSSGSEKSHTNQGLIDFQISTIWCILERFTSSRSTILSPILELKFFSCTYDIKCLVQYWKIDRLRMEKMFIPIVKLSIYNRIWMSEKYGYGNRRGLNWNLQSCQIKHDFPWVHRRKI